MKKEIAKCVINCLPPIGANIWQWIYSHDLNWWLSVMVSVATLGFIALQSYYLIRNKGMKP